MDPVILGNLITLSTNVGERDPVSGVITPTDDPDLVLEILGPDGATITLTQSDDDVVHDSLGIYHVQWLPSAQGHYIWRWSGGSALAGASEGSFDVTSDFEARVTQPNDIRTLGPMVQRALEGVVQTDWDLTPDQIKDVTADALSQILLYTGSVFGHTLNVTATDAVTLAPAEYATDQALTLPEGTVVAAQAALNYFYHQYKGIKVSEEIADEASRWQYSLSPNLLIAQLKLLQDARDRALEAIDAQSCNLEGYVSFLEIRDGATSRLIEPWIYGGSDSWGPGGVEYDPRFSSPGYSYYGIG